MKLEITKSEFLRGLGRIQSIVEKRNSMPILANTLIEAPSTGQEAPLQLALEACIDFNGGQGVHVLESHAPSEREAISPQTAYLVANMMKGVVQNGTGQYARKLNRPLAGKTGTSNDNRDAWFIGYTGVLSAGLWFGNDDNSPTNRATGGNVPAIAWQRFMTEALAGSAVADLPGAYVSQPQLAEGFESACTNTTFIELDCIRGHDSFLVDMDAFRPVICDFLEREGQFCD